jgi:beta-N-acetylhexosaminidase
VDSRPAGFSEVWLQDILREQLQFTGCVFSDDLSMEGARLIDGQQVSYTEAAVTALNAGCDMVLLCNQSVDGKTDVDELLEGLSGALAREQWDCDQDSENRRIDLLPQTAPLTWDELQHQPRYQHALTLISQLNK